MNVRAKFKVDRVESTLMAKKIDPNGNWETSNQKQVELRTIIMSPVGSSSPENKMFWEYTPSGEIKLGTINPEAWQEFELGQEIFVEFSRDTESVAQKAARIAKQLTS